MLLRHQQYCLKTGKAWNVNYEHELKISSTWHYRVAQKFPHVLYVLTDRKLSDVKFGAFLTLKMTPCGSNLKKFP